MVYGSPAVRGFSIKGFSCILNICRIVSPERRDYAIPVELDVPESMHRMEESVAKMTPEERYMKEAIRQAKKAEALGEVPIGCVIEYEGKVIGRGYNRRMADKTVLAHAEILAIKRACRKMGDWRLEGCTMYITLEPCPMCAGAIVQARVSRVVIGSMNPKAGCAGSVLNLLQEEGFNHQAEIFTGVLQEECSQMLSQFFRELRRKKPKKADTSEL